MVFTILLLSHSNDTIDLSGKRCWHGCRRAGSLDRSPPEFDAILMTPGHRRKPSKMPYITLSTTQKRPFALMVDFEFVDTCSDHLSLK